jgi:hypothetical protein
VPKNDSRLLEIDLQISPPRVFIETIDKTSFYKKPNVSKHGPSYSVYGYVVSSVRPYSALILRQACAPDPINRSLLSGFLCNEKFSSTDCSLDLSDGVK